jgi:hypothetical protein
MKQLPQERFQQARVYLFLHGRAIDQARFRFYFEGGSAEEVSAALAAYQNPDGGFGHGLEPDIRTAASSVIATTVALQHLRAIGVPAQAPIVGRAIDYLLQTYDCARQVWPIVPPAVENAPHAPWWRYTETERNFGGFVTNPRAEILGYLYAYQELVSDSLLAVLADTLLAQLRAAPDKIEMHDFLCYLRLALAPRVPAALRTAVQAKLHTALPHSVAADPQEWLGYGLQPLAVAPTPAAFLAAAFDPALLADNLTFLVEQQQPDGAWGVPWNWAFIDAAAWAAAERAWQGVQIVDNLRVLHAYGRIAG